MRADQLQRAASSVTMLLKKADLLTIIRECRVARGDQVAVSHARLGHAGATVVDALETVSQDESLVLKCTHLDVLATPAYWRSLLAEDIDEKKRQAELVQLYSRVMFATGHLPSLINLLGDVDSSAASVDLAVGEESLTIRLTDAGEKASDPDRLARAIDGIDMLYSACASLARKPAIDLQLTSAGGNPDRDISFLGDVEAIQAVKTVIESIPEVVADINPEDDLDIQQLVRTLPIFDDLQTLKKLGTFSPADLQDINDTMHQGVLLSLESGVMLIDASRSGAESAGNNGGNISAAAGAEPALSANGAAHPNGAANANGVDRDEHYSQYLAERERLQSDPASASPGVAPISQKDRDAAISNLLKGLKDDH